MSLSTTVAISFIALLVAFFVNLASDRLPLAKNFAIGIVALILFFIFFACALGINLDLAQGVTSDITRAGGRVAHAKDTQPLMYWLSVTLNVIGCAIILGMALWVSRQVFRRYGSAA